jgi:hypothetical protein
MENSGRWGRRSKFYQIRSNQLGSAVSALRGGASNLTTSHDIRPPAFEIYRLEERVEASGHVR